MKLSYQNISILADLFEEVVFIAKRGEEIPFSIGEVWFGAQPSLLIGLTDTKSGNFRFTDTTTVSDFKALCAHLGVELVEKKSHPCKHCGQPYKKHSSTKMCPTQFTFYVADLEG